MSFNHRLNDLARCEMPWKCYNEDNDDEIAAQSGGVPLDPSSIADAYDNDAFWVEQQQQQQPSRSSDIESRRAFIQSEVQPLSFLDSGIGLATEEEMDGDISYCPTIDMQPIPYSCPVPIETQGPPRYPRVVSVPESNLMAHCSRKVAPNTYANSNAPTSIHSLLKQSLGARQPAATVPATTLDSQGRSRKSQRPSFEQDQEETSVQYYQQDQDPPLPPQNVPQQLPSPPRTASQFFVRHKLQRLKERGISITKHAIICSNQHKHKKDFHAWTLVQRPISFGTLDGENASASTSLANGTLKQSPVATATSATTLAASSLSACARSSCSLVSESVVHLVQRMMESWHALPPAAQAVFDELAAQDVQRYQQEVVELIAMGRLPLSYMESLQFQPQRQRQPHKRRRQDQMSR